MAAQGETITVTLPAGGWYDIGVHIGYPENACEGGGNGFVRIFVSGSIYSSLTSDPDPAIVDRFATLRAFGNLPDDAVLHWTFGDGGSIDDAPFMGHSDPVHMWTALGTFNVTVMATTPAGSATPVSESKSFQVVVKTDPPTVSAGFQPSNPKAGDAVQFNANVGGGERDRTLLWDFGDGTTSTESKPVHTFEAADDYALSLTVRNAWGVAKWSFPLSVSAAFGTTAPESANFTFTPPSPVTQQLVNFHDQSKGAITRWRWDFGDGSPQELVQNPTHAFAQFGRKNVEIWVSNRFGRKTIVLFVDVLRNDVPPLASFTFAPFNVHVGDTVQFTDASFGATSWQWDLGEDGATSTLQNPSHTYRTSGQKAVTLRVSNAFGSDSVTKFFPCDESVSTALAANFTWSPRQPNPGDVVTFTDLSTGSPEKWTWVVSDGAQSQQQNWTHAFQQPGEYGVSLRIDKGTQTKILVQTIIVGTAAVPAANFTFSPGTPAPNETVQFANLSQNATAYAWDFGDGSSSSAIDPTHAFAIAGTYHVKLTASSSSQSSSITKDVVVSASGNTIPIANFNAVPNPAQAGKPVVFSDTSTGHPTEWIWDFGHDNLGSRLQNPEHTFPFAGTFLVTLTVKNAKGTSTPITLPVVVKNEPPKPVADFGWLPGTPAAGELVTFTDSSSNTPKDWKWTFADGGNATGASVTHTFAKAGSWNVTLTVSNVSGESTAVRTVVVTEARLEADFTFSPAAPKSGDKITFTDRSKGQPTSWKWLIDGIDEETDRDITRIFYEGGEHVIELQVRRGAEQSFKGKSVIVASPPTASFRTTGDLKTGVVIAFTDTSSGQPTKRTWFIDGKAAGNAPAILKTFKEAGEVSVRLLVENAIGIDSVTRTLPITAAVLDRPVIRAVTPEYGPCFFTLQPLMAKMTVDVDWRQQLPDTVSLDINDVDVTGAKADSSKTVLTLDTKRLDYTQRVTENRLLFTAIGNQGGASDPAKLTFFGVKTPGYLKLANFVRDTAETGRRTFTRGIYLPVSPYNGEVELPKFLGGYKFGLRRAQFKFDESYRTDCTITRSIEMTGALVLGPGFGGLRGSTSSETKLSRTSGETASQVFSLGIEGIAGFEGELPVVEVIPGMSVPCALPLISSLCGIAKVKLEVIGGIGGVVDFTLDDEGIPRFTSAGNSGTLQATVSGSAAVGSGKLEIFGGGKGTVRFAPFGDTPFIRKASAGLEYGARVTWFSFRAEYKNVSTCTYDPGKDFTCGFDPSQPSSQSVVRGLASGVLRPVPMLDRNESVEQSGIAPPILLRNVTPLADPIAAAGLDGRSILVYLSENPAAGDSLQRLDVRSMRRNAGGAWSEPRNVTSDNTGDFNPAAAITSTGRAVVAWERLGNQALTNSDVAKFEDMPKLLRTVEIAVSTNDAGSDIWSPLAVLTSNDLYDHQPSLAALSDGRTILVWLREPADGGAQQLVSRILQGDTWSAETVLAADLRGVTGLALASKGLEANLVVSRDRDGDPATKNNDLAVFVYRNGTWGARVDVTSDAEDDRSPALAYDGDSARVYWIRDGALVTRVLPAGAIETVRTATDRSAAVAPVAAVRTDGAQCVIWSSGSDLRAVLRDPQTKSWSGDIILTDRSASLDSPSAFFAPGGVLQLVALGTLLPDSSGGSAALGRSDLLNIETDFVIDLVADGSTIKAEPALPHDGELVTLHIDVTNAGRLPVRDAVVDLLRGETAIASTTVSGDWMPGETKRIDLTAKYDPASPALTVIVDRRGDAVPENNIARFSFANRPPTACFQASAGSGANPLNVTFDAGCSNDIDGSIVRYSWAFGDAGGATGQSASHAFSAAGTQSVILTVTDDMGLSSTQSMTLDIALPKDWRSAAADYSLYLPVVGRTPGVAGSFFASDVAIVNTDAEQVLSIDAVYMPDGRGDSYHKQLSLRGGELLQARDVVASLFDAANGAGSVRFDLSHPHAIAVARTYNDQPSGTAGFSNEALSRGAALTSGETGIILQHWLPGYRTNIGFTEISGVTTEITATAYDEHGLSLGNEVFTVGPYSHGQANARPLFQNRGRIELQVRGGAVFAYGSTIDGGTGDPIYQAAERRPAAGRSGSLLIPVVARVPGSNGTTWRSDVRLFNPGTDPARVTLELRTAAGTFPATVDLGVGETASFDDVIARLFPQVGNAGGALAITAPTPLMASSRTFNIGAQGTYGLYVPARTRDELLGEGETGWLVQLKENAAYRCNFGITSFDVPVEVRVRAFNAAGTTLATKTYGVPAGLNVQIGGIFADMGVPLPLDAAGMEVTVLQGRAFIYAAINDNRTGDGTFVEARR